MKKVRMIGGVDFLDLHVSGPLSEACYRLIP